jgi:hypothetical protein
MGVNGRIYAQLLSQFLQKKIFPADIQKVTEHSMHNLPPAAAPMKPAACFKKVRRIKNDLFWLDLPDGARFMIEGGRYLRKEKTQKAFSMH